MSGVLKLIVLIPLHSKLPPSPGNWSAPSGMDSVEQQEAVDKYNLY